MLNEFLELTKVVSKSELECKLNENTNLITIFNNKWEKKIKYIYSNFINCFIFNYFYFFWIINLSIKI